MFALWTGLFSILIGFVVFSVHDSGDYLYVITIATATFLIAFMARHAMSARRKVAPVGLAGGRPRWSYELAGPRPAVEPE